jgi:hypothetical protein
MTLAYGKYPKSYLDPVVLSVNRCLTRLGNNMRLGLWKVDTWPILRFVNTFHCGGGSLEFDPVCWLFF